MRKNLAQTGIRRHGQRLNMLRLSLCIAFGSASFFAYAGARTDGTVGPVQNLSGNFVVPQSLGTTKGGNLFHSFQIFNIDNGESANFTTTTPLQNVIVRVTGGSVSTINGLLQLSPLAGSQPHFYFVNPAGVIFGAGAAVDVPAGLHISTADYVKFSDGKFYVDTARASTLSSAAPEAFGFLGNSSAAIAFKDGATVNVRPQQTVTLAAGDISVNNATLQAPGATMRVAAVGNTALELALNGSSPTGTGKLSIQNGGSIDTSGDSVNGGLVNIQAGEVVIDGQGASQSTGIFSRARSMGNGNSGDMSITASGSINILNGGRISTSTAAGNAGSIRIDAALVNVDAQGQGEVTGIFSQATEGSTGQAGNISLTVGGKLAVVNGGLISSSTYATGNAGQVNINAREIVIDGSNANAPNTGIISVSDNNATGNAGNVTVNAEGKLSIIGSGQISSATNTKGTGADVKVTAAGLLIDGGGISTGINSVSGGSGNAGNVDVSIRGAVSILSQGGISTSASGSGNAGQVSLTANSMTIDGQKTDAGIYSDAGNFRQSASFNGGSGGTIDIRIADTLTLTSGGRISSTTFTAGQGGNIAVTVNTLHMDSKDGGILAETTGVGNAGNISVKTQSLQMESGATISSATHFVGNAGNVSIDTGNLSVNGKGLATGIYSDAGTQGQGNAGNVDVNVTANMTLADGGQISSATASSNNGSAGTVRVKAVNINLDGKPAEVLKDDNDQVINARTGIFSSANAGDSNGSSSGNAGVVNVTATQLQMQNGALISSSAYTQGKAGEVTVGAAKININSTAAISSEAGDTSSGYTGNVTVKATESLVMDQGVLSIRNGAQLPDNRQTGKTLLAVDAPAITLQQAQITASSSGNVAASDIALSYTDRLLSNQSAMTTSAYQGNGGAIRISGNGPLVLGNSQITTSVSGLQLGNGGDISISTPAMILRNGFIQANTAAAAANGGNVNIQVDTTIASGNQLVLSGPPQKFDGRSVNLIQAAAPDGVNGVIRLSSPQVDFSASLLNLVAQTYDLGDLAVDLCRVGSGSSLSTVGRGGLLPTATGLLRPEINAR